MTKYPSLYAALAPETDDGHQGSRVTCTASLKAIGFVWWTVTNGTQVAWHYRFGHDTGERTTERNAVQALRDLANARAGGGLQPRLELLDADQPTTVRPTPRTRPHPDTRPAVAAAPITHVTWGDAPADGPALTSAIAASLAKQRP